MEADGKLLDFYNLIAPTSGLNGQMSRKTVHGLRGSMDSAKDIKHDNRDDVEHSRLYMN
jgi:hypothetical protein